MLGVAGAGLATATGLQIGRGVALQRCARSGDASSSACETSDVLEARLAYYGAVGMATMVAGVAGAGGMLGNSIATRDVQLRNEEAKSRSFSKFFGIISIGLSSVWVLGRNIHFLRAEERCEGDLSCVAAVRPKRWIVNDIATLGISAGAGFLGYAFAYEKQGKALMKVRAVPMLSRHHGGLSVSLAF